MISTQELRTYTIHCWIEFRQKPTDRPFLCFIAPTTEHDDASGNHSVGRHNLPTTYHLVRYPRIRLDYSFRSPTTVVSANDEVRERHQQRALSEANACIDESSPDQRAVGAVNDCRETSVFFSSLFPPSFPPIAGRHAEKSYPPVDRRKRSSPPPRDLFPCSPLFFPLPAGRGAGTGYINRRAGETKGILSILAAQRRDRWTDLNCRVKVCFGNGESAARSGGNFFLFLFFFFSSMTVIARSGYRYALHYGWCKGVRIPFPDAMKMVSTATSRDALCKLLAVLRYHIRARCRYISLEAKHYRWY